MILQREKEIVHTFFKNRGSNREARSIRLKWSRNMDVAADRLVKQHDAVRKSENIVKYNNAQQTCQPVPLYYALLNVHHSSVNYGKLLLTPNTKQPSAGYV